MRVGIDFGTTHTVVALVDRGNYPVVSFDGVDAWPSLIAANAAGELRFGVDAAAVRHDPGWSVLRSIKRLLNDAGPQTEVSLAGRSYRLTELLTGFLAQLKSDLLQRSNGSLTPGEDIEAAISVPANASSAQRLLTLDAFVAAGFHVVALLNEPSAASLEYAHRYRSTITAKREYVLIYDLGGGTFDASLLKMTGHSNEVVISEGIQRLGGDDFDEAIVRLVCAGANLRDVAAGTLDLLREECAARKEAVGPQTRRFLVDLTAAGRPPFSCGIDDVYSACAPLVTPTIDLLNRILRDGSSDVAWSEVAGIYVVGGAGGFPLISRMLRSTFGEKRVKRSPHPFAATAIGLAVFLDKEAGFAFPNAFRDTSASSARPRPAPASCSTRSSARTSRCTPTARARSSSAGRTARRTTSGISASWNAAVLSTAVPTGTSLPTIRCCSRSIRPSTIATTSGASRSDGGPRGRMSRSATWSRPAARWR